MMSEQEAVQTQLAVNRTSTAVVSGLVQRTCACGQHVSANGGECEECRQKRDQMLQRAAMSNTLISDVPPIVQEVLRSPGQPLDAGTRAFMEPRFGHDFSRVRVHTDAKAAKSARAVHALAYTVGRDIVFGEGQYVPGTNAGDRLMAHELTHVMQQNNQTNLSTKLTVGQRGGNLEQEAERLAASINLESKSSRGSKSDLNLYPVKRLSRISPTVLRQSSPTQSSPADANETACSEYQPGERQQSHSEGGHLNPDVIRIAPDRLLIADFGVDWRHVKGSTQRTPELQQWLHDFEVDDTYRLSITGYSDCVGAEHRNTMLRHGRARNVENLLGPQARRRVTFRGMAALGLYVADNLTVENRAKNRGVVIQFHRELTFEPETIISTPRRCGPNVTQWLVGQMNVNKDHPTIRTMREVRWPRYIPIFNLGWTGAALYDFAQLVRGGGPWDFKSRQGRARSGLWRANQGRTCPTHNCDRTVTLCGICVNYDVPGNIHFGWIGAAANLRSWVLHFGAGIVQPGRWTDDPKDAVAVEIGEEMWRSGRDLCSQVTARQNQLNLDRTNDCFVCNQV